MTKIDILRRKKKIYGKIKFPFPVLNDKNKNP